MEGGGRSNRRVATLLAFARFWEATALDDALDVPDALITALVRPATLPAHRSGQGPPAARGDGGGDQRLPDLGLVRGRPTCGDAGVALRAAGGLGGIRRQDRMLPEPPSLE